MSKQITITISGSAGSGKTAARRILQHALTNAGIEYEVEDSDYGDSEKGMMEDIASDAAPNTNLHLKRLEGTENLNVEDHKSLRKN